MTEEQKLFFECHRLFWYDYTTGELYRAKDHRGLLTGQIAGTTHHEGYLQVYVKGRRYQVHRLIWFMHYGEFPPDQLDHINKNKADNRLENLRLSNDSLNQQNRNKGSNNTSGILGVQYSKSSSRWYARIKINRERFEGPRQVDKNRAIWDRLKLEIEHGFFNVNQRSDAALHCFKHFPFLTQALLEKHFEEKLTRKVQ